MGTLLNPKVVNDNGIAIFRYSDGTFADVSSTFVSPAAGENTLEIIAEKGVIIGNYGDSPSTNGRPAGAPQLKWWLKGAGWKISDVPEITNQGQRIAGLAAPLADFLHGRREAIATAPEGRDVLRMVQACYDSAAGGGRVKLW
jgi:predicted dehydrogenase